MARHDDTVAATMFSGGLRCTEPPDPEPAAEAYPPPALTTEAGRYLRAVASDEAPAEHTVVDDDARRLWKIAFGLVVRRRFEPDAPLSEISRTVAAAVHEHPSVAIPMLDAEMLLRAALGEQVPVEEIDPAIVVAVHVLLFATIADELALGEDELSGVIVQAEKEAS